MTDKTTMNVTLSGANTTTARTISTTANNKMDNTTTNGKLEITTQANNNLFHMES